MAGGSMRNLLGALKDTTTVNLAKVNSDYKELDIAVVKATNHAERPANEKYIREIFRSISASRPRADVAYCIHALSRRLSKTRNWAVALKVLIVIHRAFKEVDPTFREELINYGNSRSHMLNMAYFKDDSSAEAWDYSAWVRNYALFLEEKLECFRVLKYDVDTDPPRTRDLDTPDLLEQLPALQQLLFRLLGCQPQGASSYNVIIQHALSMVALEGVKIYNSITDGNVNLVDKFFEMKRDDACRALDIYRRASQQGERLSEFFELCKSIHIGRGELLLKIEQPPVSFLQAMEDYISEAARPSTARKEQANGNGAAKIVLPIEYKRKSDVEEAAAPPPPPPPEPVPEPEETVESPAVKEEEPPVDLLGMSDNKPDTADLDHQNALALAIVPIDDATSAAPSAVGNAENGVTGWELALVTAPSSNETAVSSSKLAGGLDKLTLDSLYDEAHRRASQPASYNPWEPAPMASSALMLPAPHDPFYASSAVAAPHNVQMALMAQQQQAFLQQQQQQMMMMNGGIPQHPHLAAPANPFASPYTANGAYPYGPGMPVYSANTHGGLI